jgi:hypothetical protein
MQECCQNRNRPTSILFEERSFSIGTGGGSRSTTKPDHPWDAGRWIRLSVQFQDQSLCRVDQGLTFHCAKSRMDGQQSDLGNKCLQLQSDRYLASSIEASSRRLQ